MVRVTSFFQKYALVIAILSFVACIVVINNYARFESRLLHVHYMTTMWENVWRYWFLYALLLVGGWFINGCLNNMTSRRLGYFGWYDVDESIHFVEPLGIPLWFWVANVLFALLVRHVGSFWLAPILIVWFYAHTPILAGIIIRLIVVEKK